MDDTIIDEIKSHKHLDLTFSSTYTYTSTEHVNNTYVCDKAWTRMNFLQVLKFRISRKSLAILYFSNIYPLLKYSDMCVLDKYWSTQLSQKKQLEAIHTGAARLVFGVAKLCSIDKLFMDLGLESLQSRRNIHKLLLFYKILCCIIPNNLSELLPHLVQETATYCLRNSYNIQNY